ncbi:MAG: Long-chain-fatty-acid--CoA ligase [Aeromicrobium sp.]|nr:Long-chain-fatty-acid--CoA ligase [Aeromicrobium sp.]
MTESPSTTSTAKPPSSFGILRRSGLVAPLRPDKYVRMAAVIRKEGVTATSGIALAARRRPHGAAIIDEIGQLTWRELEQRCHALAAGLKKTCPEGIGTVGILCRNHRGLIEALVSTARVGADALLLNTGFAGPQLAEVVQREGVDLLIYDEEFAGIVDAIAAVPNPPRTLVAWEDSHAAGEGTIEALISAHLGVVAPPPEKQGRIVLLTSGTTGTPKGARRQAGGDIATVVAILERIPWKAEEAVVVAAPMFHAWGFGQVLLASTMTCTIVCRRHFDPEATLELVARHRAAGIVVVPVMIERIADLPEHLRRRHDDSSLRFATASGSRMRPEAVLQFMDDFGDIIYNSYNATEAGMIATATPADLRVAPDTAGRAVNGTTIRILDDDGQPVENGATGQIFVRNDTQFDGYTSGDSKEFLEGFMASGDVGRLDDEGRLYVVGRVDDMIVSGGENVYPLEVEQCLIEHDSVQEAVILGVDDVTFGQRLAAYVVPTPGATIEVSVLKDHVRAHLASYKVPRDITVLDELPRNATGKVMKRELVRPGGHDS